ncbi:MAG: hypothetical protein WC813_02295 [Patescibacteria group bacterium]
MHKQTRAVMLLAVTLIGGSTIALVLSSRLHRTEIAVAALLTHYTNNGAPAARAKANATNILVLDVGIPDAWNGTAYTADIVKKAGSATFFQGNVLSIFTALGSVNGVGYKEDGTGGFQGTEQVVRDLDADSVYTSAADTLVDGDGSTTTGIGTVSASIDIGGALVAMGNNIAQGGRAVCTNSLTAPTAVRIDTDGNCGNAGSDNGTYILGTSATAAATEVTNAWAFATSVAMGGDGDAAYDNGEDIFIENFAGELTYSSTADDNVYSLAGLVAGNALVNFAADCDGAGAGTQGCGYTGSSPIDSTRSIVVDQGTAGGAAPNSVLDIQADQLRGLGVRNNGGAVNATDIAAVKVWKENGTTAGFQNAQDVVLGTMTVNSTNNQEWRLGSLTDTIPAGGLRLYVTTDIAGTPTNNSLLTFLLPVYSDAGGDLVVSQNGDVGVFVASTNDGPTDGALLNAASQVIDTAVPTLTESVPVSSPTNDTTPAYTFTSNEAGSIAYGGDCSSSITTAVAGSNAISFNTLGAGSHTNCTIRVTDTAGNISAILAVSAFTIDVTAPTIAEVTPVPTATSDITPDYSFSSDEVGTIAYTGDCASSTSDAVVGTNTITFNSLGQGLHNNCTIRLTDAATNQSNLLAVSAFTVDTDAPVLSETTPVPVETLDVTPDYTFFSTESGTISYLGDCSSANTSANAGNTTVTFNTLADGVHDNCRITVTDSAGNPSALLVVSTFEVDTTPPSVMNVTSSSPNGEYAPGAAIPITITFNETVYVTNRPRLQLETGDTDEYALYEAGNGTDTLTFDYYVQTGNASLDLDYLATTSLTLNGGTIKDAAADPAVLTLPAPGAAGSLGANKALVIVPTTADTTAPFVNDVFSVTANGAYAAGSVITLLVHWSETVVVTNTPELTLNTAPVAAVATYVSGSGDHELLFRFTVGADMLASDLDYASVSALSLGGGTIMDLAGNNADLVLPSPGGIGSLSATSALLIDSITPTLSETTPVDTFTNDPTPAYTFNSSEAGTIIFGGDCSSGMTSAVSGSNLITFNTLADGLHNNCTVKVRDTAGNENVALAVTPFTVNTSIPLVINVTSSVANGIYGVGAVIPIQVAFDEVVIASGLPRITLETGSINAHAIYVSGSNSSILTFNYTVSSGDSASRLDYLNSSALTYDGGSIEDQAGNSALLTLPIPGATGSLGANKNIEIDTVAPFLFEVTPVYTPTIDTTPSYVFNSTSAGVITYGGGCTSVTVNATAGDNTITFSTLTVGSYNNCTITVSDAADNDSNVLAVSPFSVSSPQQAGFLNVQIASIRLTKDTVPPTLSSVGLPVIYGYKVFNSGNTVLYNIRVTDDTCWPVTFSGGDTDGDGTLGLAEVWKYSCSTVLDKSTFNIATVTAEHSGRQITDTAELYVPVMELGVSIGISLDKSAIPTFLPSTGGQATFTYKVSNPGTVHITDVEVTDDYCEPVSYASGDVDNDGKLDPDEIWVYSCMDMITETTTNKGLVTGIAKGLPVQDDAQVTISIEEQSFDVVPGEGIKPGLEGLKQLGIPMHALLKVKGNQAVYYIGADGLAHPFPRERIFFTWYCDYGDLAIVDQELFSKLGRGADVSFAPGVLMIKRPEDSKVYAIEKGSVLRWIVSEELASALYGKNWNKTIIDVVNFDGYTLGKEISTASDYNSLTARKAVTYPSDGMGIDGYTDSLPGEGLACLDRWRSSAR